MLHEMAGYCCHVLEKQQPGIQSLSIRVRVQRISRVLRSKVWGWLTGWFSSEEARATRKSSWAELGWLGLERGGIEAELSCWRKKRRGGGGARTASRRWIGKEECYIGGGGCYYLGTPDCSGWGSVWAEFFGYESARFPLSLWAGCVRFFWI